MVRAQQGLHLAGYPLHPPVVWVLLAVLQARTGGYPYAVAQLLRRPAQQQQWVRLQGAKARRLVPIWQVLEWLAAGGRQGVVAGVWGVCGGLVERLQGRRLG